MRAYPAFVQVTPELTCAAQCARAADHLEAVGDDAQRLLDALRCAHLALMAAMVVALLGSAGVGAYPDGLAAQHLAFMQGDEPQFPPDRTLHFAELFKRTQEPGRMEWSEPLVFTQHEIKAARTMDWFRQLVDHPKSTSWSIETGQLLTVLEAFPSLLEKVMAAARHRYLDGADATAAAALVRIKAALAT